MSQRPYLEVVSKESTEQTSHKGSDALRFAIRAACTGVVRAALRLGASVDLLKDEFEAAVKDGLHDEFGDLGISERLMAERHKTYPNKIRRNRAHMNPDRLKELYRRNVARALQQFPEEQRTSAEITAYLERLYEIRLVCWLQEWRSSDPHGFSQSSIALEELIRLETKIKADEHLSVLMANASPLLDAHPGPLRLSSDYLVWDALMDLKKKGRVVQIPGVMGFDTKWRLAAGTLSWEDDGDQDVQVSAAADRISESVLTFSRVLKTKLEGDTPDDRAVRIKCGVPQFKTKEERLKFNAGLKSAIDDFEKLYGVDPIKRVLVTLTIRHLMVMLVACVFGVAGAPQAVAKTYTTDQQVQMDPSDDAPGLTESDE